ncbi:phage tail protein I [Escherichia coli]
MTLIIPRKEAPVSGEGTVVIPQPAGDEPVIKNTFFFPDIDPKRVRERMRLEQTVAPARLREAIKSGMAETNAELYEYREQKIAAGFTRLADVPADDIDGESIKVFYYERAVCAMATASLYERYRGVDASAKGDKKADSIDSTIDELWRDMRWAVARIQDNPDTCPANLLPWLAWSFSVDRWDDKWPEATKRAVIRDAYFIHCHKGTIGAIRRVVEPLGYLIEVREWWQLNEEPGTFRIVVGVLEQGITEEMYQELERLVADAKPASRHLTGLAISLSTTGNIFAGAGCYHGDALTVYPYTPEAIIVGGDYFPASAIHLIDNLRVNA